MSSSNEMRTRLIEFVRRDLIGPANGDTEVLDDAPRIRYAAGVLFPQETEQNESAAVAGVEVDDLVSADDNEVGTEISPSDSSTAKSDEDHSADSFEPENSGDDPVTLANTLKPSGMGLSFFVSAPCNRLRVTCRAGIYEAKRVATLDGKREKTEWRRIPITIDAVCADLDVDGIEHVIAPGLKLKCVSRTRSGGHLVTISLFNATTARQASAVTYFQTGFEVTAEDESRCFGEYRFGEVNVDNAEEMALSMQYSSRCAFAVGHGCSAEWSDIQGSRCRRVATEFAPAVLVPPIVPRGGDRQYLNMELLCGRTEVDEARIPEILEELCEEYHQWIALSDAKREVLDSRFANVARAQVELCRVALGRMRKGIELLRENDFALKTFMLVNEAMLMQQYHSRLRRKLHEPWKVLPDQGQYHSDWTQGVGYWRTFQLAFLLMTMPGVFSDESLTTLGGEDVVDRDLVDLIWFPTGGGKTEAYLAVAAFVMLLSRRRQPDRKGMRVLMRYTLRLLTTQQFQRAASLICACEILRRRSPKVLGTEPFGIGLWVGMASTPNKEKDALKKLADLRQKPDTSKNPFQLLSCPWCGSELNNVDSLGYEERGGRMIFRCPSGAGHESSDCPFVAVTSPLPVTVVDESIYRNPPTLLIGTVDKFAMLTWREEAGALFDVGGGPDLIIQDELHLISGPLGSMVGLFEAAIDYLAMKGSRRPKIIASTATIRRAREQCIALYDRKMFQFPPSGLEASDSFFAYEEHDSGRVAGRIYMGFLPTAASSPLTAQIRSIVALQQGALLTVDKPSNARALDPYWTLIQYFSSLKELGRAATFVSADIPEFLPTMHRRYSVAPERKRWSNHSEELTSRKNEDEIPKILKRLESKYTFGAERSEQALDTVLATNMISVGMDVDRLGLMMVVTQPKGTAEYIQASSRVGRKEPGLVFTLYNASRPRDRSHYEYFKAYHEAFYRFVEPTSVTPFSPPAMERALHAILIIGARHVARWATPDEFDFELDTELDAPQSIRSETASAARFREFLRFLKRRVESVDPEHAKEFRCLTQRLLGEWSERRPKRWGDFGNDRDEPVLMREAGTPPTPMDQDSWETPTSMRNVDVECGVQVVARYPVAAVGDAS